MKKYYTRVCNFHYGSNSKNLVKKGILELTPDLKNPYIFFHGQSSLLNDEIISKDLDQIRNLFDDIENKSNFLDILDNTIKGQGVQIFIGSENFLFTFPSPKFSTTLRDLGNTSILMVLSDLFPPIRSTSPQTC